MLSTGNCYSRKNAVILRKCHEGRRHGRGEPDGGKVLLGHKHSEDIMKFFDRQTGLLQVVVDRERIVAGRDRQRGGCCRSL